MKAAAEPRAARVPPSSASWEGLVPAEVQTRLKNSPSAQWLAETYALVEGFTAAAAAADQRAADAAAQVTRFKAEAAAYRKSAAVFTKLFDELPVVEEPEPEAAPAAIADARHKPAGHWARRYNACIDCGTTTIPHLANGRCRNCDPRWRQGKPLARKAAR